jgi:hypothetical protein
VLDKDLEVDVDASSFPHGVVPPALSGLASARIDMGAALLMLGTVTIPGGFSQASPATHWAWLRYFSAISADAELRITQPFAELDPHLMSVLSDDFGVAICTQLLHDRLGGLVDVVDGRRFLVNYDYLLATKVRAKTAKVGPGKCPDFVMLDRKGKWHVLECKGTQSGRGYLATQLKRALSQKKVIDVVGSAKGLQLAAGVALTSDPIDKSFMQIKDPIAEDPLIRIDPSRGKPKRIMRRLAAARALGLAGMQELADEFSLPPYPSEGVAEFFFPAERRRLAQPVQERFARAFSALAERTQRPLGDDAMEYVGRRVVVEVPGADFRTNAGKRRVRVEVGVQRGFVDQLRGFEKDPYGQLDDLAKGYLSDGITVESEDRRVVVRDGSLFFASLEFV